MRIIVILFTTAPILSFKNPTIGPTYWILKEVLVWPELESGVEALKKEMFREILWGVRNLFGRETALALQFDLVNMGSAAIHQFQFWHH